MGKGERRALRREQLKDIATELGQPFDAGDKTSIASLCIALLDKMGMSATTNANGSLSYPNIDDNLYPVFSKNLPFRESALFAEAVRLTKIYRAGGPRKAGDISHVQISAIARQILEHHLGFEWRKYLSRQIRNDYAISQSYRRYREIDETLGCQKIAFKLVDGRILVRADMGNVAYKNDNIVIPDMLITPSMALALEGKDIVDVVQGGPYESVLRGTPIARAFCDNKTTVLKLVEQLEIIGEQP